MYSADTLTTEILKGSRNIPQNVIETTFLQKRNQSNNFSGYKKKLFFFWYLSRSLRGYSIPIGFADYHQSIRSLASAYAPNLGRQLEITEQSYERSHLTQFNLAYSAAMSVTVCQYEVQSQFSHTQFNDNSGFPFNTLLVPNIFFRRELNSTIAQFIDVSGKV